MFGELAKAFIQLAPGHQPSTQTAVSVLEHARGRLARFKVPAYLEFVEAFPMTPSARIQKAITTSSVWGSKAGAAPDDVVTTWKQLVALHRQRHSLVRELREAEHALGQEMTEANYSWLQDVKARLSDLDGTEALIEGFENGCKKGAKKGAQKSALQSLCAGGWRVNRGLMTRADTPPEGRIGEWNPGRLPLSLLT